MQSVVLDCLAFGFLRSPVVRAEGAEQALKPILVRATFAHQPRRTHQPAPVRMRTSDPQAPLWRSFRCVLTVSAGLHCPELPSWLCLQRSISQDAPNEGLAGSF